MSYACTNHLLQSFINPVPAGTILPSDAAQAIKKYMHNCT